MMLSSSLENIGSLDALLVAVTGYGVVFLGLILLMLVVLAMAKAFTAKKQVASAAPAKAAAPAPAAPAPAAAEAPAPALAPGSAGELKLYNVKPKTAAMIMAIVADTMGKPLNELRFISIKEVKE